MLGLITALLAFNVPMDFDLSKPVPTLSCQVIVAQQYFQGIAVSKQVRLEKLCTDQLDLSQPAKNVQTTIRFINKKGNVQSKSTTTNRGIVVEETSSKVAPKDIKSLTNDGKYDIEQVEVKYTFSDPDQPGDDKLAVKQLK
jgi:hypothetical protein